MATNIQIVFYSTYGHVYQLAKAIAEGAREQDNVEVQVLQVAETLPMEVLEKMGAVEAKKAFAHVPIADPKRLADADAIILGSPTRYGSATAQMQAFLDATGQLWSSGAMIGKIGSAFTSTASQHGGQETTLLSMSTFFFHQGMAIVGVPYMAAKAGVKHFMRHAAYELAAYGIRVNAIAPGPFVTNIGDGWVKKNPAAKAAWDELVPVGRMAETWQIKPVALLLASDAGSYMTGAHVMIDGGMQLGPVKPLNE